MAHTLHSYQVNCSEKFHLGSGKTLFVTHYDGPTRGHSNTLVSDEVQADQDKITALETWAGGKLGAGESILAIQVYDKANIRIFRADSNGDEISPLDEHYDNESAGDKATIDAATGLATSKVPV